MSTKLVSIYMYQLVSAKNQHIIWMTCSIDSHVIYTGLKITEQFPVKNALCLI